MRGSRLFYVAAAVALVLPALGVGAVADSDPVIRPGAKIRVVGHGDCTANFVFEDAEGETYVGTAAHCVDHEIGANVRLLEEAPSEGDVTQAGPVIGDIAYSSWEKLDVQSQTCLVVFSCSGHPNDLALVDVREQFEDDVRPGLHVYGGPTGVHPADEVEPLDPVASFGNSTLRPGPDVADRHDGVVQHRSGTYVAAVNFHNPGIPGDSGSPVLTEDGRALGVLTTLSATDNGVALLEPMLAFAEGNGMGELKLVTSELDSPTLENRPAPFS